MSIFLKKQGFLINIKETRVALNTNNVENDINVSTFETWYCASKFYHLIATIKVNLSQSSLVEIFIEAINSTRKYHSIA